MRLFVQRYKIIICTWKANFAANFAQFIHHQFCALHRSQKTCIWLHPFVYFIHLYMNPLRQNKHYKKCPLFSSEAATRGVLCEKVFLEISHNSQENKKDTLAQVFFCGFCEIFKNTFFTEHL